MKMFYICDVWYVVIYSALELSTHVWLLNTWNVTKPTEELNSKFYLILINLNVNGHVWLMATIIDSAALGYVNNYVNEYFCR